MTDASQILSAVLQQIPPARLAGYLLDASAQVSDIDLSDQLYTLSRVPQHTASLLAQSIAMYLSYTTLGGLDGSL